MDHFTVIEDPNSFRALCHVPRNLDAKSLPLPLLIYLHGAGENGASKDVWAVAASKHKTEGTPPELLSCGTATADLADGFIVIAPHSKRGWIREVTAANRAEPLLRFMDFLAVRMGVPGSGVPTFDTQRVYVTGHSDGATAALKAATTGRFAACLAVSCGGGVEATQLRGVPVWLFHGANDVILPVRCSDTLSAALLKVNGEEGPARMRYTRYDVAPPASGRAAGHLPYMAYKDAEVYRWLLSKSLAPSLPGSQPA